MNRLRSTAARRASDPRVALPLRLLRDLAAATGVALLMGATCLNQVATRPSSAPPKPCNGDASCFLTRPAGGSSAGAVAYYKRHGAGYGDLRPVPADATFAKWKTFWFKTGGMPELVVVFYDQNHLGLAREVHCADTGVNLHYVPACYAYSFGPRPGDPGYPDPQGALAQAVAHARGQGGTPIGISAIDSWFGDVWTGGPATEFYEFDIGGNLLTSFRFDAGGPRPIPQVCMACHGIGKDNYDPSQPGGGSFIPFAPDSYQYSAEPGFGLADQRDKFAAINRALNYEVHDASAAGVAIALATNTVPDGWKRESGAWLNLVGPYCIACHFGRVAPETNFYTSASFVARAMEIRRDICVTHTMPNAAPGFDQFWRTDLLGVMLDDPSVLPPPVAGSGDRRCMPAPSP